MCGISGMVCKLDNVDKEQIINKMNDLISHRGPDGEGTYMEEKIALGHRRLSIIDLDEKANQPFINDKYVLVFNGEIYNYLEIKQELNTYQYKTHSDTEVILAAYEKWQENCTDHLEGMWSFILYDRIKHKVFCSRDRFGIKPFYYYETCKGMYFASEIKQFTCIDEWKPYANIERLKDFVLFEMFDHTEETMFEGVKQLRPGTNMLYDIDNDRYTINTYYDIKDAEVLKDKYEDVKARIYHKMESSVAKHMQADVTIGSCLSGGLDSSSIVMLVNKLKDKNIKQKVISSCFHEKKYDEQEYIDEVVKKADIDIHKVYPKFEDLFNELEKITWHQDEPFGSTSIFAQWNVFRTANEEKIKVMLDGQGADEVFCGYNGFYSAYLGEMIRKCKWITWIKEVNSLKKYYYVKTSDIIKMSVKYLLPNTIKAKLKIKFNKGCIGWVHMDTGYYKKYLNRLYKQPIRDLKSYSYNQLLLESLPKLLHYEDRDSMAFSIEARVPFLDRQLVEYVINLPSKEKIHNSITKYCLREAMKEILPEKVKERRDKMGFVTPEEVWIRENKELFRAEFIDACKRLNKIIDTDKALKWFDELIASGRKIDFTIWRVISAGYWVKVFNVQFDQED